MLKNLPFQQWTLGHVIRHQAETRGDDAFLQFETKAPVSYAEVDSISNRIANGLIALGVRKGDKVATLLPNSIQSVCLWFGISKTGAIDVPINIANKGYFLSHQLNDSDSSVFIIDVALLDRLTFIAKDLPKLKTVVVWSSDKISAEKPGSPFNTVQYDELIAHNGVAPDVNVKSTEPQTLIYTSGTTGAAKGVLQSHAMIYLSAKEYIEATQATAEDVFFTCLPIFHANARILCLYPAMQLGTKAVIHARLSASNFWNQIKAAKATIFNSLGAMAHFIYSQPRKADDAENPVRICAAFPMPGPIYEDFQKRFGLKVIEGYGLTEVAIITYNPFEGPKKGSCGKATKSFEVQIVDENDWPLATGAVGEIVARGRVPWATALGYYNKPEKSLELMRNHFFHTGDAGYLDEDGYLFFVDRIKDYIRRRGENISSFEIEGVVVSHPQVAEAAAVSVKSELSEDEVKIVVVLRPDSRLASEALLDFCQQRMPYFAVPRYVEFVSKLPKTPNEKIQKNKLRETGINPATWDREKAGYQVKR